MAKKVMEYCVEACRGCSLASHTAASLVISAKKKAPEFTALLVEAARLLRLGESLARTAVALLSSCSTSGDTAAGAHRGAPLGEPVARADAASCEPAQKKKKKKKKRKNKNKDLGGPEVLPYEVGDAMMDVGCRPGPYVRPGAAARDTGFGKSMVSQSSGHVPHDGQPDGSLLPAGTHVVLVGLASRAELAGMMAVVFSWCAASDRYAVKLTGSGQSILVRPCNIRPSIFGSIAGST